VQEIQWERGAVRVRAGNNIFLAHQVLITVPLGVLLAEAGSTGALRFSPALPHMQPALANLGFGAVIKVCLEFRTAFWAKENNSLAVPVKAPEMAFLFSDSSLFTAWWSQLPEPVPLLTAWLGGPATAALKDAPDSEMVAKALADLATMFNTTASFLKEQLRASQVFNWAADPFARGAYAYATINAAAACQTIATPIQDTVFFAGEGLYVGTAMGTVEAALATGSEAARNILG
jgi:monoamine oxidase